MLDKTKAKAKHKKTKTKNNNNNNKIVRTGTAVSLLPGRSWVSSRCSFMKEKVKGKKGGEGENQMTRQGQKEVRGTKKVEKERNDRERNEFGEGRK